MPADVPLVLTDVPVRPNIFLPAYEGDRSDVLDLTVTDTAGQPVAGTIVSAYLVYNVLEEIFGDFTASRSVIHPVMSRTVTETVVASSATIMPPGRGGVSAVLRSLLWGLLVWCRAKWAAWGVLLATVLMGTSAFAETAVSPCYHYENDWWSVDNDIPVVLSDVPLRPHILLPAREPWRTTSATTEERFGPSILEVKVTDGEGQLIAGRITSSDFLGKFEKLSRVPLWRPDADLRPGLAYTLELTVFASPVNWVENWNCSQQPGFSRTVRFTVAETPPRPPTMTLNVSLVGRTRIEETFVGCDEPYDWRCPWSEHLCCRRQVMSTWDRTVELNIRGLLPPPYYTVLEFSFDHIFHWVGEGSWVIHPVLSRMNSGIFSDPDEGTPVEGGGCVTVVVRSLMLSNADSILARTRACPDGYRTESPNPNFGPFCNLDMCTRLEPFDPGPERVEEALSDPDPSDDVSPESKSSNGCAGGAPVGGLLAAVWGLIVWCRAKRVAWGVLLATMGVGTDASAELPASPCDNKENVWWTIAYDIPVVLSDVPLRPNILLPVREPWRTASGPIEERYGPDVLEVKVTDSEGQVIAGRVTSANELGPFDELERVPLWRPDADLRVGLSYVLELTVFESPISWVEDYPRCNQGFRFSRFVWFSVPETPPEPPTLTLDVSLVGGTNVLETFGGCDSGTYDRRCAGSDEVCCRRQLVPMWFRRVTGDIRGPLPHAFYMALEFEREEIMPWVGRGSSVKYPVLWRSIGQSLSDEGEGTPVDGGGCVTVTVRSLLVSGPESVLARTRACPNGYTTEPLSPNIGRHCNPDMCRQRDPSIEPSSPSSDGCAGGASGLLGGLGWVGLAAVLRRRVRGW